jgi:type IV pilus assembly protein PilB
MMTDIRATCEEDTAIVKLVSRILAKAIEDRATHLYFEPQAKSLQIGIRKDGVLQTALQNLPHKMVAPTIEYLKTTAQIPLNSAAPQVGTIHHTSKIGRVTIEITTLPTQFGDRITAKIIYTQQQPFSLSHLMPNSEILNPIQALINSDRGLILIVGGQDSGKSTTVATSLAALIQANRQIYAIDRQLKYTIPGVNQIILPGASSETIVHTIVTCLSQQADVLAIGCIDTLAIAQIALQAVARGCLVLATIQAPTAGEAIAQLINLGVSSAQLYTATIGIVAQKLLKQTCDRCRLSYEPESRELAQLGSTPLRVSDRRQYYQANSLSLYEIEQAKQTGKLCAKCQGLGYHGRTGLHEVSIITDRLKSAMISGDAERIDLAVQETGMRSFLDLAVKLFQVGDTTLAEVKRCVSPKILLQNQLAEADTYRDNSQPDLDEEASLATAIYWKQQAEKVQADYQQLLSELENYQHESDHFDQRIKQSRSQAEQATRSEIALQLLSVIDVIELARTSIKPQTDREAAIQKGYSMLETKMLGSIKEIGVRVTETIGRKFDPHLHEVLQEIGTHEHPAGTILEEFKRGYTLGDRVLRLAQVKVAISSSFA